MNNDMNLNNQQYQNTNNANVNNMNSNMNNNQQYQNTNNMNGNDMNSNMNNNQQNYYNYQNYNNQNQSLPQQNPKKNNNIMKIIFIVLALIIGIFIVVKVFGGSTTGGENVEVGGEKTIKNKLYNMTISVGDVQRGVVYTNSGSLSSVFDLDGTYTKVKVTIKNNASKEIGINSYVVTMNLMDSSKNKITYCSYGSSILDEKLANEKLQEKVPANSTISGYVYCKTDSNLGTILNVNIPSNASKNDAGEYSIDLDEYYFTLN